MVRSARAFTRDHGSAERVLRRAASTERRALGGLFHPAQNLAAQALAGFLGHDVVDLEHAQGVVCPILVTQAQAALGQEANAAPLSVTDLEHFLQQCLRSSIAVGLHDAAVLVVDAVQARLQMLHGPPDPLQQIQGLETADHDRDAVVLGDG
jgi:hypothetical protein